MASIVYDAALSARENPAMRISYSRTKTYYAAAGRYEGTEYGYDTVVPAVDALVEAGLLVDHHKVKASKIRRGVQSSFRPAPELAGILLPKPDYRMGELIRLKDAAGNLVGYRDTERTMRDRRFLEDVNRHMASADIRIHGINGVVADDNAGTIFFPGFLQWLDDGIADHTVYTRMKQLYRVYNGAWTLGGRFYGGWWQQVRGRDRRHLHIDGGETVELDYETLHPRLLYAAAGQKLDGDAYALDGWDRNACKRAFNILLNAGSYREALGAIRPHVGNSRKAAVSLIAAMKQRHSAVADAFHSGVGLRLQNLDAEMAKLVMRDLTVRRGITVLPVHDSFIVRNEHQPVLEEAMDRAYDQITASVGIRRTASKGWPEINLHTVGASGSMMGGEGAAPAMPGHDQPKGASLEHGTDLPQDACDMRVVAALADAVPSTIILRPMTDARACCPVASVEQPSSCPVLEQPETAHRSLLLPSMASEKGKPETSARRPPEAPQPPDRNPSPAVNPAKSVKVVPPPAFLDPANRNRVLAEELKRLAGRPLKDRPTIDCLGKRAR
jgi:hypothetical protein